MKLSTHPNLMPPFVNGKQDWQPETIQGFKIGDYHFPIFADRDISPTLLHKWRQVEGIKRLTLVKPRHVIVAIGSSVDLKRVFGAKTIHDVPAILLKRLPTA